MNIFPTLAHPSPVTQKLRTVPFRSIFYCSLLSLLSLFVLTAEAQESFQPDNNFLQVKEFFDQSYGEDFNLRSGKQYAHHYFDVSSHQFFNSALYREGSLTIKGNKYAGVLINYDIYNQLLVLQHTDYSGRTELLQLTEEFIEQFTIDGKLFVKMTFQQTGTSFFQVIQSGKLACLSYWEKDLVYSPSAMESSYSFNKQLRRTFLLKEEQLRSFSSKSSFVKNFNQEIQHDIKRYLRREKMYFRQLSDENLIRILEFCNSIGAGRHD